MHESPVFLKNPVELQQFFRKSAVMEEGRNTKSVDFFAEKEFTA